MDKRKLSLLKYLLNNCSEGYKVIDTQKILVSIKKYKKNYEMLVKDIEYLKQMQYIDLKYIDEMNVCLSIKDNSRILQENLKVEKSSTRQMQLYLILTMVATGIMSFIGAFLAILLIR